MPSTENQLNLRQRTFAELIATGVAPRDAYLEAGYRAGTERALAVCSSRLQLDPEIEAYVRELRIAAGQLVTDPETEARLAEERRHASILAIREKREFLARLVRTPIGELDEHSDLCQEIQRSRRVVGRGEAATPWETERVKMPSKLDAIRLDSVLSGELADEEAKPANNVVISVELLREIQERRAAAMARMGITLAPVDAPANSPDAGTVGDGRKGDETSGNPG